MEGEEKMKKKIDRGEDEETMRGGEDGKGGLRMCRRTGGEKKQMTGRKEWMTEDCKGGKNFKEV